MGLSRTGSEACLVYIPYSRRYAARWHGPIRRGRLAAAARSTRAADLLRCSESLTTGTVSRPDPAAARQTAQHTTSTP